MSNGYPRKFEEKAISRQLKCEQLNGNSATSDQLEKLQTVQIPFLDGLSQEVRRIARTAGVRCAFYTPNTLQSLYQTKEPLPQETETNVVYAVKCKTCDAALYWAGVVSVRLGAIAEKKVSQHFCVRVSVCVRQPVH